MMPASNSDATLPALLRCLAAGRTLLPALAAFGILWSSAGFAPVAAQDDARSRRGQTDADNAGRKKVEVRLSSEAQLAKGEINFDDLQFDIEKDAAFEKDMWTDRLKRIDGKKVRLRGYILPSSTYQNKGFTQFVLVRDNQECCFGPGAALYDCVWVSMNTGKTADFTTRPVTVEGKFVLDDKTYRYPEGTAPGTATHMAVFRIEGIKVQ